MGYAFLRLNSFPDVAWSEFLILVLYMLTYWAHFIIGIYEIQQNSDVVFTRFSDTIQTLNSYP